MRDIVPDFASILANVERDATTRDPRPVPASPRLRALAVETEARAAPDRHAARLAYASQAALHRISNDAPPLPTVGALRAAIAAARDAAQLRRLRRLAARALHPDRGGDHAGLAECNALIDAALRISRKGT